VEEGLKMLAVVLCGVYSPLFIYFLYVGWIACSVLGYCGLLKF
jgi:hypothetical protein